MLYDSLSDYYPNEMTSLFMKIIKQLTSISAPKLEDIV